MKLKLRNWYNKIVKNRFRSKNGRSIGDPQNCSLLEALAENDQLKAELADERIMYKSLSSMHHAAKQDWFCEREGLKAENLILREIAWLNHGHEGMYGDDGEMQCSACVPYGFWDWKRTPAKEIKHKIEGAKLRKALEGSGRRTGMSCHSKEELEEMLFDVVDALDLSEEVIAEHGPMGTPPAQLVRLVLEQKDKTIRMLKEGMVDVQERKALEGGE